MTRASQVEVISSLASTAPSGLGTTRSGGSVEEEEVPPSQDSPVT